MADKTKKTEVFYYLAKRFVHEKNLIYFCGDFYLFNEGVWRLESLENSRAWITKEYIKDQSDVPRSNDVKEIISLIQAETYEAYRKEIKYLATRQMKNEVNTLSGVLDLHTLQMREYVKEDFYFAKLPFDYLAEPECPLMIKFLESSMMVDSGTEEGIRTINFIQEWMGYTLLPSNRLNKALIMYGDGRNGKGVLQYIWSVILGKHNVSYVDIKYINDGSEIWMTKNKLVNFSADLEANQQLDTGIIKRATSEEPITVNEKYKAQYDMPFTAKLVIACNELPYIRNVGAAVKERFLLLPFDRVFTESERDPELKYKLEAEAQQIFSWAVNGLQRLNKRGRFDPPDKCTLASSEYLRDNDVVELWLNEGGYEQVGMESLRGDVWNNFKEYSFDSGHKLMRKGKFFDRLKKKGHGFRQTSNGWVVEDINIPKDILL